MVVSHGPLLLPRRCCWCQRIALKTLESKRIVIDLLTVVGCLPKSHITWQAMVVGLVIAAENVMSSVVLYGLFLIECILVEDDVPGYCNSS